MTGHDTHPPERGGAHSIRRQSLAATLVVSFAFIALIVGGAMGGGWLMQQQEALDAAMDDHFALDAYGRAMDQIHRGTLLIAQGDRARGSALVFQGERLAGAQRQRLYQSDFVPRDMVEDLLDAEVTMRRYRSDARQIISYLEQHADTIDVDEWTIKSGRVTARLNAMGALNKAIGLKRTLLDDLLVERIEATELLVERAGYWLTVAGLGAALLISALALGLNGRVFRRLTLSLEALQQATQKVAEGDLSARVTVSRDDEVGRIGRAFNHMVHALSQNVHKRQKAEEKLHNLAYYDVLTGLPNRSLFIERVAHSLEQRRGRDDRMAIMFLDVDRFKNINDTLGHQIGDLLLKTFAQRVNGSLRTGDSLCRLSGDEFAILLEHVEGSEAASRVAERIIESMSKAFQVDGNELFVTTSIGISTFPEDGTEVGVLLKKADTAMYRAKDEGRNCFHFHSEEMSREAAERMRLEVGIRNALANGEFQMYYQPKVDAASGQVAGAEALMRWIHPEWGMVSPVQFIPILEETGMINEVGMWALQTACKEAAHWHPDLHVAVNLGARQLYDPRFAEMAAEAMADANLSPHRLELELTETIVMEDTQVVHGNLMAVRAMGCKLAIDDFGTGYSSLSYLTRFAADVLKIDRSFVLEMDEGHGVVVKGVIDMAHGLGMSVVAEGVETAGQLAQLQGYRCDVIQGFYFSGPLPPEAFRRFVAEFKPVPADAARRVSAPRSSDGAQ